jgi:hypothetical protein
LLPNVDLEVSAKKSTPASNGYVKISNIQSNCPSSIKILTDSVTLGSGWCFYKVEYPINSSNYSLQFDAKLDKGDGYGIWFRGNYGNGRVESLGVQYDPGAGGIKFVKYPETELSFHHIKYKCDNNWHRWVLDGNESNVKVFLDEKLLYEGNIKSQGSNFGFRTWRGTVQIKNIKIIMN